MAIAGSMIITANPVPGSAEPGLRYPESSHRALR